MIVGSEQRLEARPDCPRPDKVAYTSRAAARQSQKAIKRRGSKGKGVRAYQCTCEFWHVGNLPPATMRGDRTANEVYGRAS